LHKAKISCLQGEKLKKLSPKVLYNRGLIELLWILWVEQKFPMRLFIEFKLISFQFQKGRQVGYTKKKEKQNKTNKNTRNLKRGRVRSQTYKIAWEWIKS